MPLFCTHSLMSPWTLLCPPPKVNCRDMSQIYTPTVSCHACHFWNSGAQHCLWRENLLGPMLEKTCGDVICSSNNCSNRMTCHFKCKPCCLDFPDNCSECIRCKHRPIIRVCKWPTASTASELRAEPESHYCTFDISKNTFSAYHCETSAERVYSDFCIF